MLPRPEAAEVVALIPEGPPRQFRWRGVLHQVAEAQGPERIAPEWWRRTAEETRDYYVVEDAAGRRFWLYRAGLYGRERRHPAMVRAWGVWMSATSKSISRLAADLLSRRLSQKGRAREPSCSCRSRVDPIDQRLVERDVDPHRSAGIGKQRNGEQHGTGFDGCSHILIEENLVYRARRAPRVGLRSRRLPHADEALRRHSQQPLPPYRQPRSTPRRPGTIRRRRCPAPFR